MATNIDALTEKEKQTLRLIVRGHDAKSIARELDLSIHTINERLRDVRRKMAVSSSREAARALFEEEGADPDSFGDKQIGEALTAQPVDQLAVPENGAGPKRPWFLLGVAVMSLILALAAVTSLPQAVLAPADTTPSASAEAAEVEAAARQFLTLGDQGKWAESYALTADSFHKLNTLQVWTQVSEKVRPPLGAVKSRSLLSRDWVPTPPAGYQMVKFRTDFANKANAIETVTLEHANQGWRVAGITID